MKRHLYLISSEASYNMIIYHSYCLHESITYCRSDKCKSLLPNKSANPFMQSLHSAIAEAVKNKSYDWKVMRVSQDGEVEYK